MLLQWRAVLISRVEGQNPSPSDRGAARPRLEKDVWKKSGKLPSWYLVIQFPRVFKHHPFWWWSSDVWSTNSIYIFLGENSYNSLTWLGFPLLNHHCWVNRHWMFLRFWLQWLDFPIEVSGGHFPYFSPPFPVTTRNGRPDLWGNKSNKNNWRW